MTSAWPFHAVLDMNFQGNTERMLDFFVAESDLSRSWMHCAGRGCWRLSL